MICNVFESGNLIKKNVLVSPWTILSGQTFSDDSGITGITGGTLSGGSWNVSQTTTASGNYTVTSVTVGSVNLDGYAKISLAGSTVVTVTGGSGNHRSQVILRKGGTDVWVYDTDYTSSGGTISKETDISALNGEYQIVLSDINHNDGGTSRVTSGISLTSIVLTT